MMTFNINVDAKKFCDKIWLYKWGKNNLLNVDSPIGNDSGMLTIRLTANHRIETLSYVDNDNHDSGYYYWDYDEVKKYVLFMNKDYETVLATSLPYELEDGTCTMNIIDGEDRFISYEDLNDYQTPQPVINGTKMAFIMEQEWYTTNFNLLQKNNFNINTTRSPKRPYDFFLEVYEHLMQHPRIEDVIIATTNNQIDKVNFNKMLNDKLILQKDIDSSFFSKDIIIGKRARILEFFNILFLAINQYQLSHDNVLPYLEGIFNDVLREFFSGRIDTV